MARLTSLLVVLWVGVTVGTVVDLQKRILGGHDCLNTERLYHVQLRTSYPDKFICGGSLISAQWILTAAHCWNLRLYAVVGVHPGPGKQMNVRPHFFVDNQNKEHDIMLLEITNPNPTRIQPVSLPNCRGHPRIGTVVQIAGHTRTTVDPVTRIKGSVDSKTLLCVDSDVVDCMDYRICLQKTDAQSWATISHEHWLCYQRAGVDVSGGDSGGGVVYNGMIYGVIVFGNDYACAKATASMDVCSYMGWIERTTGIP